MIVIAGVTGHVGGAAARSLLAQGKAIKVIVRDAAKGEDWAAKGAEVAVGSLEDPTFLAGALRGAEAFFALLPPNFAFPSADAVYAWQRSTAAGIARAVDEAKVPTTVMLSSIGADLDAGNGPIKGLFHLEQALRKTATKLVAIRATFFMENIANSIGAAKGAGIFANFLPSADIPMPMIATQDIGALAAEQLASPPAEATVIDLSGPAYSVRQQAEILGQALGKTLQIIDIPQEQWIGAMTQAGLPPHVAEIYAEMYGGFGSGAIAPRGDRLVLGQTELPSVVQALLG